MLNNYIYVPVDNAKIFKEEMQKKNVKNSNALNLTSLRLGINTILALSNSSQLRTIEKLQLADNAITDYGMNAIKNIINATKLTSLGLASNMISGEGLEVLLDDLIASTTLKHLDLGVLDTSMRKNSLGLQGAVCIAAILVRNQNVQSLCVNDNDFDADGGICIGIALSQNENLEILKIADNDLRSEGAIAIIQNAGNLATLNLAKNDLKSDVGKPLERLLNKSRKLKRLSLEHNDLGVHGSKFLAQGIQRNNSLEYLNLKGNVIGDQGMILLA